MALSKLRMKKMTAEERSEVARRGDPVGGVARAEGLSAKRRKENAPEAAKAKWEKARKAGK